LWKAVVYLLKDGLNFLRRHAGDYESIQLSSQHSEIDLDVSAGAVVEGVRHSGVKVDEAGNSFGMAAANGAELLSCDRVADEDGALEAEGIEDREDVIA
jgi:hypothetical protein